ncbi:hypothetical protein H0E87_015856 [Populus deltoides]|uniref:Agenet domain-containing protein n=1 Tax=Populus deltoides TaxID=3696 RepID=A0A8T2Y6T5_POPDE|nr:hypothetical protein H0E87_015856 [Populus deltoides]
MLRSCVVILKLKPSCKSAKGSCLCKCIGSLPHGPSIQAGSLDNSDASRLDMETFKDNQSRKLGHYYSEFLWLGSPWTCRKRRKHYESFCRNGVKISVHDFVYVLAEESKRLVAYLEDLYEDSKGNKMVKYRMHRWIGHRPESSAFQEEILRYLTIPPSNYLANSHHPFSGSRGEGNDNDASRMRPKKMLRRSKDNDGVCTGSKELLTARYINMQSFHTSRVDGKTGYAFLSTAEVMQNPPQSLNVSSEVEVLSQDSGIRGCWFRVSIIKKHKDKVKVRYQDISDAANEAQKLEEWVLVSRVAAPDQLAIRISGRTVVRPTPQFNKGQMASVADVGTAVDAWWNDAWWEGIVVHKETEDRIHVFFPGLKIPSLKLDCKTVLSPVQLAIRISGRTVVRPTPQFNKGQMASVADVGTAVDAWWNDAWWEGIVVHKETEDRIHVFFPGLKIPSLKLDCKTVLSPVSQQYFVTFPGMVGKCVETYQGKARYSVTLSSCLERKQVTFISDESKLAEVAIPGSRQSGKANPECGDYPLESRLDMRKELKALPDLSKDNLLAQLRWSSIKKRRGGSGSSGHKMHHNNNGGLRLSAVVGSNAGERFLIPTSLKVDHEICKFMGDSLFTCAVVQPLTDLVMSR